MSRRDDQCLADILAAAGAIAEHLDRGDLDDGLVFDAVRVRLIEIGEAVKATDPGLLVREPSIPWVDVAGMRNHLAHLEVLEVDRGPAQRDELSTTGAADSGDMKEQAELGVARSPGRLNQADEQSPGPAA